MPGGEGIPVWTGMVPSRNKAASRVGKHKGALASGLPTLRGKKDTARLTGTRKKRVQIARYLILRIRDNPDSSETFFIFLFFVLFIF